MRFERVKNWRSYLPIVDVVRGYGRADFDQDLVAGLVVGVVTIPQAMAYAYLAGLPPQAGLYACLLPMLIYAALGSSQHMVVGPVAVAALMVVATIADHADKASPTDVAAILCVQVGVILLIIRLTRTGGVVNLLSHPVITGFINAAAILIVVSQIPAFAGLDPVSGGNPIAQLVAIANALPQVDPATMAVGAGSLVLLVGLRQLSSSAGRMAPMIVTCLAIIVVSTLGLDAAYGLATVGHVPSGLPTPSIPPFDPALWGSLAPSAALIALVAYVESYSIGSTLAARRQRRINGHQELIALGAANLGAAFTGAFPVAGSFSRSSVNYQSGARTPMSSVYCAVVIVITLLFLTPLFTKLPTAALAAIVMVSVVGMMDLTSSKRHWKVYYQDSITELSTMACVLLFGVETGLLTGVALSVIFFVRRSSKPHITQVGRVGTTEHFRSVRRYDVQTQPSVAAVRVDENLYFANANQIEDKLIKTVERRPGTQHLLLVCSAVNVIDVSGLEMLLRVNARLSRYAVAFHLAEVKGPLMAQFDETRLREELTGDVFFTTDQAMVALAERDV